MDIYPILLKGLRDQENLLELCSENGHDRLLPFFINWALPNTKQQAFILAVKNGHLKAAQFMFETNSVTRRTVSESLYLGVLSGSLRIVQYLVSIGAYLNNNDNNPLRIACLSESKEMVKFLVENGASLENNYGEHVIYQASRGGNIPVLRCLLALDYTRHHLDQALYSAVFYPNQIEFLKILLGLNPNLDLNPVQL